MRENNWFQHQNGILDDATWRAYRGSILAVLSAPRRRTWWHDFWVERLFDPRFIAVLDDLISDAPLYETSPRWKKARLQQCRGLDVICFGVGFGLGNNFVQIFEHVTHARDTLIVDRNTHGRFSNTGPNNLGSNRVRQPAFSASGHSSSTFSISSQFPQSHANEHSPE